MSIICSWYEMTDKHLVSKYTMVRKTVMWEWKDNAACPSVMTKVERRTWVDQPNTMRVCGIDQSTLPKGSSAASIFRGHHRCGNGKSSKDSTKIWEIKLLKTWAWACMTQLYKGEKTGEEIKTLRNRRVKKYIILSTYSSCRKSESMRWYLQNAGISEEHWHSTPYLVGSRTILNIMTTI